MCKVRGQADVHTEVGECLKHESFYSKKGDGIIEERKNNGVQLKILNNLSSASIDN